jgi:undecaprenyl-diphosphatase
MNPSPADPRGRTARAVLLVAVPAVLFLLLLWAVSPHHGAPAGPDRSLHHWAVHHRTPGLNSAARALTSTGSGVVPYVVALLAGWIACPRSATARQKVTAAVAAIAVLLAGQGVRTGVNTAVARHRPPAADWVASATGSAFPSGHTTSSALAAGLLAWAVLRSGAPRPVVRICLAVCALWTLVVGATRVYLGVHWPTDVLGGWLLAAAWLALTLPLLTRYALPRGGAPEHESGPGPGPEPGSESDAPAAPKPPAGE